MIQALYSRLLAIFARTRIKIYMKITFYYVINLIYESVIIHTFFQLSIDFTGLRSFSFVSSSFHSSFYNSETRVITINLRYLLLIIKLKLTSFSFVLLCVIISGLSVINCNINPLCSAVTRRLQNQYKTKIYSNIKTSVTKF